MEQHSHWTAGARTISGWRLFQPTGHQGGGGARSSSAFKVEARARNVAPPGQDEVGIAARCAETWEPRQLQGLKWLDSQSTATTGGTEFGGGSTSRSSAGSSTGSRLSSHSSASSGYRPLTDKQKFEEMQRVARESTSVQTALLERRQRVQQEVRESNRSSSHKSGYMVKQGRSVREVDLVQRREKETGRKFEHPCQCNCDTCAEKKRLFIIERGTEERIKVEAEMSRRMADSIRSKVGTMTRA